MAKALVITSSADIKVIDFVVGDSYGTISSAVDGLIECVALPSFGADLWVNEEGKMISLPHNPLGSILWAKEYGHTDFIVGDIIITGGADEEGETLGLSDEQLQQITSYLEEIFVS